MLNRRIIRGKVLQNIFAYKMSEAANADLARDLILERFLPDLNSMEPQDIIQLEGFTKLALVLLEEYFKTTSVNREKAPKEVLEGVDRAVELYEINNKKDIARINRKLIEDAEQLYSNYLQTMIILPELAEKLTLYKKISKLENNKAIEIIKNHIELNKQVLKQNLTWAADQDVITSLITQITEDKDCKAFFAISSPSYEEQKGIVLLIFRNIIFKNLLYNEYFENKNLFWEEDKTALKDMVGDTIKSLEEIGNMEMSIISKNWDDDQLFMQKLFNTTIEEERRSENLISPKLKNWDISRLTTTDSIIIKLCIAEMIHFAQIPLKVSINEYIELSKRYSTPKSKTLINGVLDIISNDLQQDGTIKKSGRGLIDNK